MATDDPELLFANEYFEAIMKDYKGLEFSIPKPLLEFCGPREALVLGKLIELWVIRKRAGASIVTITKDHKYFHGMGRQMARAAEDLDLIELVRFDKLRHQLILNIPKLRDVLDEKL